MQLTHLIAPLFLLASTATASSFTLIKDKKWYGDGCSLRIEDVCGCTKTVNINHAYGCKDLPDVYTHGGVCGGSWTLWTSKGKPNYIGLYNRTYEYHAQDLSVHPLGTQSKWLVQKTTESSPRNGSLANCHETLVPTQETRASPPPYVLPAHPPRNPHPHPPPPRPKNPQLTSPPDARITKRPLLHPPIPSPYTSASQPKIIYISATTPFISAVKRVRKLLDLIQKRSTGKSKLIDDANANANANAPGNNDKQNLRALAAAVSGGGGADGSKAGKEEVILKATNRAIEKALGLAVFFQGQEDLRVRLRTGSQGVVDDVEVLGGGKRERGKGAKRKGEGKGKGKGKKGEEDGGEEEWGGIEGDSRDGMEVVEEEEEVPETRIRRVSVLEVGIGLR
ncbi:MAG: hypothetical protein LQ350_006256 [Teloschistes chrysophthalmus]|nr:MAG: hypothetical protein LQ350_006256 [Niorma chrysophthalma]